MAKTVSQELTSFTGCALKGFAIFIILLLIARAVVIPLWEMWSVAQEKHGDAQILGQMVAYINHERQLGSSKSQKDLFDDGVVHLGWDRNQEQGWKAIGWRDIECREVPREKRTGELSKVDYYLVKKEGRIGLLSDGRLIARPFDLDAAGRDLPQYRSMLR